MMSGKNGNVKSSKHDKSQFQRFGYIALAMKNLDITPYCVTDH
jgi:hypothetical protein